MNSYFKRFVVVWCDAKYRYETFDHQFDIMIGHIRLVPIERLRIEQQRFEIIDDLLN